jgi:hypothetical protein
MILHHGVNHSEVHGRNDLRLNVDAQGDRRGHNEGDLNGLLLQNEEHVYPRDHLHCDVLDARQHSSEFSSLVLLLQHGSHGDRGCVILQVRFSFWHRNADQSSSPGDRRQVSYF